MISEFLMLEAGIHGPKPIGPGPNIFRSRTEPDQGQQNLENLGPIRIGPCIILIFQNSFDVIFK